MRVKKRLKRNGRTEELGEGAIQFGSLDELSGLIDAERVLKRVAGIAITRLTSADVVRHPLVARIVDAYDKTTPAPASADTPTAIEKVATSTRPSRVKSRNGS